MARRSPKPVSKSPSVRIDPTLARAIELLNAGRHADAQELVDKVVKARPKDAAAVRIKGLVEMRRGRYDDAERWLTKASKLDPRNPMTPLDRAALHKLRGRYPEMVASCREALRKNPGHRAAESMLARALESAGELESALEHIRSVGSRRALDPDIGDALVTVLDLLGRDDEALEAADGLLAAKGVPAPIRRRTGLRRGRILERRGELDAALDSWESAQKELPVTFDPDGFDRRLDQVAAAMPAPEAADAWQAASESSAAPEGTRPIFIAAMPRSGTSLLERMIAAHPSVVGIGEAAMVTETIREHRELLGDDQMLGLLKADRETTARLRLEAARRARELAGDTPYAISKHLQNWMHLPTIGRWFPSAPVVRLVRDPAATAISIFGQDLPADRMPWVTSLEWIGRVLATERRFVELVRPKLVNPWITVAFEDLLQRPEPETRRLLGELGLPFDEGCLAHHLAESTTSRSGAQRFMPTLSLHQVRRPIDPTLAHRGGAWSGRMDAFHRGFDERAS